ncbi:hypothetical protein CLAFUW4_13546 [Fulvia fulva]|uniref:GPI anchored serine-threonine rich protein n=1 Tax=Passalora fulva TaxID=5499 RepID=A0A9Q8UVY5_PASFU|nr:uncharacterized protein CLAFUR5_13397 [Fulvia fulva]KAK4610392.1 hypothetical protein CLAFUR4_13548 [Fulvia fulva]KAK4611244.1 hypothetical protein CLAFUR0_13557 [Fulvia fulva]UJO24415.1 hypothetical protein CLAFUR5_13397 [Fulvia fulva]WPV22250.1 hypothetical protein CLAFUW4_13546 [Fulvia fulva]WPV37244.1 hypothetical protein CLAFUW7_13553 [Fulvia fulva]
MRSTATLIILAAAGFAAAQTQNQFEAESGCGTQIDDIIANCLGTQTAQLNSCEVNDWACMCEQQNNVLTCYNNCPSDPRKAAADSQKVSWCGAAKAANPNSTTSSRPSMTMTATSGAASGTMTGTATESQQAATNSMPGSSAATDSAAVANGVYPGALAAVFGLAALL